MSASLGSIRSVSKSAAPVHAPLHTHRARLHLRQCYASAGANGTVDASVAEREDVKASSINAQSLQSWSAITVGDLMTSPARTIAPDTSVMDAMSILVEHGISGMPVADADGKLLGVCSGYDLLALDSTPGKLDKSFFPPIDTCINEFGGDRKMMWSTFKKLRQKLNSVNGSTVAEVMHKAFKIGRDAPMETAANIIVQKGAHRICVVDQNDKLLGIVSRGDIMRATITNFQKFMDRQDDASAPAQAENA